MDLDHLYKKHNINSESEHYQRHLEAKTPFMSQGLFCYAVREAIEEYCMQFVPMTDARIKEIAENWFGHLICDMGYDPFHPAYDDLKEKHLDCFVANLRMALAEAVKPNKSAITEL